MSLPVINDLPAQNQTPKQQSIRDFNFAVAPVHRRQRMAAALGSAVRLVYGEQPLGAQVAIAAEYAGDLLVVMIHGYGEFNAIVEHRLNDQALPAGITVNDYVGTTTQGVDTWLAAAIPGFNCDFVIRAEDYEIPLAYTVARIPTGALASSTFSWVTIVQGRKVIDPRTSLWVYSENPALHAYDLATSKALGGGFAVVGAEACADWCEDTSVGEVRCQAGFVIDRSQPALNVLDMIARHAELRRTWQGNAMRFVPDAPVDLNAAPVLGTQQVYEFSARTISTLDRPTTMEGTYSEVPVGDKTKWTATPIRRSLPGVSAGLVTSVPGTMNWESLTRPTECARKISQELHRLRSSARYNLLITDVGVRYESGDAIKVDLPDLNYHLHPLLIDSVSLVEPGVYRVAAQNYDPNYWDMGEVGATTVPVGLIIPQLHGDTTPSGFTAYTDCNGRAPVMPGAVALNANSGSSSVTISGVTSVQPGHIGEIDGNMTNVTGTGSISTTKTSAAAATMSAPHSHTYNKVAAGILPLYKNVKLIKCTGTGFGVPRECAMFSATRIESQNVFPVTTDLGRIIFAGVNYDTGGDDSPLQSLQLSLEDAHGHGGGDLDTVPGVQLGVRGYQEVAPHRHNGTTVELSLSPKVIELALYASDIGFAVLPGMQAYWDQAPAALPPGWAVLDGTNGTIDATDCMIRLAAPPDAAGEAFVPTIPGVDQPYGAGGISGDGTASWSAVTTADGRHNHYSGYTAPSGTPTVQAAHDTDEPNHHHTLSGSVPYLPPVRGLYIVEWQGV